MNVACRILSNGDCKNLCEKSGPQRRLYTHVAGDKLTIKCIGVEYLAQMCIRINNVNDLSYYDGCFYDGEPYYYKTLKWGSTYELRDLVSMVKLIHDPYNYAYR